MVGAGMFVVAKTQQPQIKISSSIKQYSCTDGCQRMMFSDVTPQE